MRKFSHSQKKFLTRQILCPFLARTFPSQPHPIQGHFRQNSNSIQSKEENVSLSLSSHFCVKAKFLQKAIKNASCIALHCIVFLFKKKNTTQHNTARWSLFVCLSLSSWNHRRSIFVSEKYHSTHRERREKRERMLVQRRVMTWRRVGKSLHALVAHGLLFAFTILLVLKLDHAVRYPWWFVVFLFPLLFPFWRTVWLPGN